MVTTKIWLSHNWNEPSVCQDKALFCFTCFPYRSDVFISKGTEIIWNVLCCTGSLRLFILFRFPSDLFVSASRDAAKCLLSSETCVGKQWTSGMCMSIASNRVLSWRRRLLSWSSLLLCCLEYTRTHLESISTSALYLGCFLLLNLQSIESPLVS